MKSIDKEQPNTAIYIMGQGRFPYIMLLFFLCVGLVKLELKNIFKKIKKKLFCTGGLK